MSVDRFDRVASVLRRIQRRAPRSEAFYGWLLASPVVVLFTLVTLIPIGFAIFTSLYRIPLASTEWTFVGLENYAVTLTDPTFWESVSRGVVYMVGSTLLQLAVGVWMALVLHRLRVADRIVSALVFTGYMMPVVVLLLVAEFMMDPFVGILTVLGEDVLGLWNGYLLGIKSLAMPAVVVIGSWKFSVFVAIFVLAQRQSIQDELYESAKVCGATTWDMFKDITLPRLKGVILVVVLLRSIFMFNKFPVIWILTEGGPGRTTMTLPILAYRTTFFDGQFGRGTTIAVIMGFFLLLGAIVYFKLFNPSEEVETQT